MDPVNVGIDFGSTALRVAYATGPGEPIHSVRTGTEGDAWFGAQRSTATGIGVEFVTAKSLLGGGRGARPEEASPGSFVVDALLATRQAVEADAGRPVEQAVISVPARFSSSQRVTLRDAVLSAGFPSVHLITDSVAAVVAHNRQLRLAGTFLVYGMGYAGFELGLVRVVGAHYRSLGYEGGDKPGGAAFEEALLATWVTTLQGLDELGDLGRFGDHWLELRASAQLVKEVLGTSDVATFPVAGQRGSRVVFHRAGFEEWVRPMVAATAQQARRLLADAEMTVADLDAVILVGGSSRLPVVRQTLAAELDAPLVTGQLEDLAIGAAVRAAELSVRPAAASVEADLGAGPVLDDATDVASAGIPVATVVTARGSPANYSRAGSANVALNGTDQRKETSGDTSVAPPLDAVRRLVEAGDRATAATLLRQFVADAQAMLASLDIGPAPKVRPPAVPPSTVPPPTVRRRSRSTKLLARARQMLAAGRYEEAVGESHVAWRNAQDSVEVFDAMIDVHCEAAMAEISIDRYPDADRWLRCAYNHDQSNARVRQLLAERTYLHAGQLNDVGRRREAVNAVNESLALDPDHAKAQQLQKLLVRSRPTPPAGPTG